MISFILKNTLLKLSNGIHGWIKSILNSPLFDFFFPFITIHDFFLVGLKIEFVAFNQMLRSKELCAIRGLLDQ